MRPHFSLFNSHLELAHLLWLRFLKPGMLAVDATLGNGHDSLFLAREVLKSPKGRLISFDIQTEALASAKVRLESALSAQQMQRVELLHRSHADMRMILSPGEADVIVFNLGYLPGGDKQKTTMTEETILSLEQAVTCLSSGGLLSITCYPGHAEGKREAEAVLHYCQALPKQLFSVTHTRWVNRKTNPELIILQKLLDPAESNHL